MEAHRILQQMHFIAELDQLKKVLRRTSPIGVERRENSAEHSWQVVLCAMMLQEHANEPIDMLRVVRMLTIHDAVEIDVGDTFHYDKASQPDLAERENAAAERIFALLPAEQGREYLALWREFEARATPEARYAAAIDRAVAFVMNFHNKGGTWQSHNLSADQILAANSHIEAGSEAIWSWVQDTVREGLERGYISRR